LGTRRSVERLARSGRIAIDGTPATDPAQPVGPSAAVTLDGHPLLARSPCGVVVRSGEVELPRLAHPAVLHVAGRNAAQRLLVALDDERLAARLLERGYDPGHLIVGELAEGAFRPLSPAELTAADVYARRAVSRRPPTL
jgi:16S rRNA U516 pseudouridylate synthase RsuA-like enzyme